MARYRKKRVYKRRTRKTQGGWFNTAKKALSIATRVAALVNAEAKDYYLTQATFATGNPGNLFSLNGGITQGSADGQWSGDSVKCKTVTIRGDMTRNAVDDVVRVLLVWDKENSVTVSNLLQYVGNSQVVNAPKNDDNYYDSKILLDKRYVIDTNNPKRLFKIVYKINSHTKYNNTTNAIENGSLKLLIYSQQAAATGTNMEWISKLTYMDN